MTTPYRQFLTVTTYPLRWEGPAKLEHFDNKGNIVPNPCVANVYWDTLMQRMIYRNQQGDMVEKLSFLIQTPKRLNVVLGGSHGAFLL